MTCSSKKWSVGHEAGIKKKDGGFGWKSKRSSKKMVGPVKSQCALENKMKWRNEVDKKKWIKTMWIEKKKWIKTKWINKRSGLKRSG